MWRGKRSRGRNSIGKSPKLIFRIARYSGNESALAFRELAPGTYPLAQKLRENKKKSPGLGLNPHKTAKLIEAPNRSQGQSLSSEAPPALQVPRLWKTRELSPPSATRQNF